MQNSIAQIKSQATRLEGGNEEHGGSWYGHVKNIFMGWNTTTSTGRKSDREADKLDTTQPFGFDTSYYGTMGDSQISRYASFWFI